MDAHQFSWLLAFVLALLELVTGDFIFLGIAVGMVAVATTQWLGGGLSLNRDFLVLAIFSVVAIYGFRKIFKKFKDEPVDPNRY